jgi:hypothetical protein
MSANVFQIMKREEGLLQDGSISTVQCPSIVQESLIHPGINPYDTCVFRSTKRKKRNSRELGPSVCAFGARISYCLAQMLASCLETPDL